MCEFTGKLIAWIDGELGTGEAAQLEQHLAACAECRNCVAECRRVSGVFAQYCEAMAAAEEASAARRWAPVLCGVAAVAAAFVALVLAVPRARVASPALRLATPPASVASASSAAAQAEAPPAEVTTTHSASHRELRRHSELDARSRVAAKAAFPRPCPAETCGPAPTDAQPASWLANGAAIQIAIPAEAMFPPGALPEGVNFVADVSLGADGTVEQLRLQPRLIRFEKGAH
jgi:hypothetical protein